MKTWLEYINEQAIVVALDVRPDGGFEPVGAYIISRGEDELLAVPTRAEVEAFIAGVWFGRTGKVGA